MLNTEIRQVIKQLLLSLIVDLSGHLSIIIFKSMLDVRLMCPLSSVYQPIQMFVHDAMIIMVQLIDDRYDYVNYYNCTLLPSVFLNYVFSSRTYFGLILCHS